MSGTLLNEGDTHRVEKTGLQGCFSTFPECEKDSHLCPTRWAPLAAEVPT